MPVSLKRVSVAINETLSLFSGPYGVVLPSAVQTGCYYIPKVDGWVKSPDVCFSCHRQVKRELFRLLKRHAHG